MSASLKATKKRTTGRRSNKNFIQEEILLPSAHRSDLDPSDQADEGQQVPRLLALDQLQVRSVGVRLAERRVHRLPAAAGARQRGEQIGMALALGAPLAQHVDGGEGVDRLLGDVLVHPGEDAVDLF